MDVRMPIQREPVRRGAVRVILRAVSGAEGVSRGCGVARGLWKAGVAAVCLNSAEEARPLREQGGCV